MEVIIHVIKSKPKYNYINNINIIKLILKRLNETQLCFSVLFLLFAEKHWIFL